MLQAVSTMETFLWKDGVDKDGGWRGGGVGQAASTVDTFLEVSVAGVERWGPSGDLMLIVGVHQMFLVLPFYGKLTRIILI